MGIILISNHDIGINHGGVRQNCCWMAELFQRIFMMFS